MHAVTATSAQRASAAALVAEVGESASMEWMSEEVGRIARIVAEDPTAYNICLLGEWADLLAARATAMTGLTTAAADTHVRRFLNAPTTWQAEQVALSATIVALDPTPYNVSLLRAWKRTLTVVAESPLVMAS